MRTFVFFAFSTLVACASEKQTATVGSCPEGTALSDNGECVETEADGAENDATEGDVNADENEDDSDEDGDEEDDSDSEEADEDEDDGGVPEDLDPLEEDVSGKSYAIDLSTATWVKPDLALLTSLLDDALDIKVLMAVEEATDETLDLVGALPDTDSEDLIQDTCLPTLDLDPIDFDDSPYFEVGPTDFPIDLFGVSLTVLDMNIKGIFEPDGAGMYDIGLAGALDLRELLPVVSPFLEGFGEVLGIDPDDPEGTCDSIAILGIGCEECPEDDEPVCIALELKDILADEVETEVIPISEDDIADDCE